MANLSNKIMTFEEIQEILNGMLKIQQDIQIQQVKNTDAITNLTENIANLNVVSQRHENRLTALYGYQQTADSDRLNIMQGLLDIKKRLNSIEEKIGEG